MISMAVLGRYARSLADVAFETHEEDAVGRDLTIYREIFQSVPELLEAFHSPAVPRDAKANVLAELLSRYPVRKTSENFLRLLLAHNRIRFFEQVYQSYLKTVDERKGVLTAKVATAAPLSAADLASLSERLSQATGRTVRLDVNTDPDLLGGIVVQVESTVYDGSVSKQLAEMRRHLSED